MQEIENRDCPYFSCRKIWDSPYFLNMESYLNYENSEEDSITQLEITPLVAVALVLVMVFMVTAPLFVEPEMEIALPKAVTGEDEERENVTVSITSSGQWAVNENIVSYEKVAPLLEDKIEQSKEKYVVIRADQAALHRWLVKAMAVCKQSGAKTVSIAVEQKKTTGK